jgi:hypothetical protein
VTDQHAQDYYAPAGGPDVATQVGAVEAWHIPADTISGPLTGSGGMGTNACNFAGLSETEPNDIVNSGNGPIPPTPSVIPTI